METEIYQPHHNIRVVTATSLFDGHDAAINVMRRILQDTGVEVIHLGHNRSVDEIVRAAVEEDAQGIAVSSYQGGHVEFFKYIIDSLNDHDAAHIKLFGGGGGVIVPDEIRELEEYGVTRIYSPEDGARLGLQGIINDLVSRLDFSTLAERSVEASALSPDNPAAVARMISRIRMEETRGGQALAALKYELAGVTPDRRVPVVGLTGTGGAGKSSLLDELILRFLMDDENIRIAVICADPSRRKTGGALLGDRIRMNAINSPRVYMRSLATRRSHTEIPTAMPETVAVARAAGYDLIIVETAGIGQGDSHVYDLVDVSLYVMTSDFGASSQLEKIDMLDFADLVAVNKFEKQGSEDALRDVRKQMQRNRGAWETAPEEMPAYGTIAAKFNDDGVTALYHALRQVIADKTGVQFSSSLPRPETRCSSARSILIPAERVRYLSEIADTVRNYHRQTRDQAERLRRQWHLEETARALSETDEAAAPAGLADLIDRAKNEISEETRQVMEDWKGLKSAYQDDELVYTVRGNELRLPLTTVSLAGSRVPKIALPDYTDPGDLFTWLRKENLPGYFPYTAGVFPLKRVGEDPTRMFAGEGDPARTNRRFKLLSADAEAKRLSTAFDSVTLYGHDPETRPDIYGKVGTSGVSVCTIDDVKVLYDGFDLCSPENSVSMTINGPAPIMLAMFLNTAIDQQVERFSAEQNRAPTAEEHESIRRQVLETIRGTVQADILKEDQGQNTCIFSIEFALKMMGDIQQFFIDHNVRN
ncbi:MAG: methylmalonyl-CoA mutase family protein, partial [Desulfosudaceae bacterium]